jgi:hypothetical protein
MKRGPNLGSPVKGGLCVGVVAPGQGAEQFGGTSGVPQLCGAEILFQHFKDRSKTEIKIPLDCVIIIRSLTHREA